MKKLDSARRKKALPAGDIIARLKLRPGDRVVDIGCGTGYFAIPASDAVGRNGRVYAVDVSKEMLAELKKMSLNRRNIGYINSSADNFSGKNIRADMVLVFFVFHEIGEKTKFLRHMYALLKKGGRIALIDWQKKKTSLGPPVSHRVSRAAAEKWLNKAGFIGLREEYIKRTFYCLVARKPCASYGRTTDRAC